MSGSSGQGAAAPRERYLALDSLRGIAALMIVFYHMGDFGWIAGVFPFRFGWMLVDFFFILSGFVIATSYGGRLAQGYPRGKFLLIRLGRIYPLHFVTVCLFVALEFLVFRPLLHESHPMTELARGVFLLDAFARGAGNFYAPVSRAIAVEVVFYIGAVLLFGRGRPALAVVLVLAGASAWALHSGFNVVGFGRLLQRGLLGFPLGVFAFAVHQRARAFDPGPLALSLAEFALLALCAALLWVPGKTADWIPGMDVLFTAMVLVFARDRGIASQLLHAPWLVKLGQLSFAIYMVHLFYVILPNRFLPPLFRALGHADWVNQGRHTFGLLSVDPPAWIATGITLVLLALILTTAWLAWRFIEEPAREWSKQWGAGRAAAPAEAVLPAM